VTYTNWQSYSGETTLGYLTQMVGLTTQDFVSAAAPQAQHGPCPLKPIGRPSLRLLFAARGGLNGILICRAIASQ
jgi:hypothetical protein